MKRLISWVLTLVMILGMVPAVAFLAVESSAAESTAYTYVQQKPATIADSDTGTKGAWYNNDSTFVTTEGSANYAEIVAEGYKDAGALHVYQDNVANNDMSLGVFLGGQPTGTYTVKLYVKGDLGLMDQTCKFYIPGLEDQSPNLHTKLGTTDIADWTEVSYEINAATEFYYFIFSFSKYNWQSDMYVDNVQLINASGVDVLNGAGNFCTLEEVAADSADTNQWPDASKLDTATISNAYGNTLTNAWTPMYPSGTPGDNTWADWNDTHYAEVVANGYKDAGSLHLVSTDGNNTGIAINAGMTAGETYTLGFYAKGTVNTGKVLGMYANGDGTIIGATETFGAGWNYYEHTFTAGMSQINIVAANWGSVDIYLDNITLKNSAGLDMLAGNGDFYTGAAKNYYTVMQEKAASIIPADNGTVGAWYNNGSTFVTTEGSANYFEIVEDGYKDAGAFHVYQDDVTNSDMSMGVFLGGQAAGTYTVKLYVKGDLGLLDQTCKFYPYGCDSKVSNLHNILGTTDVADWTEVSYEVTADTDFYYLIFNFSKYNWATDMYVDNVQLINASGVDVLNGAGNFCTLEEVTVSSEDTNQWPDASKLDTTVISGAYGNTLTDAWTPMYPAGAADEGTWAAWDDVHYAEISANGYKDAGSLHLVSCGGKNTGVAINAGMTAGETYTLGFYAKGTVNTGKVLGMYANGDGTIIADTASFGAGWNYYEHTFTAGMSQINIVAADWGSVDIYLDNITLTDANGVDLLAGNGDFWRDTEEEPEEPTEPEITEPVVEGLAVISDSAERAYRWYWNNMTYTQTDYSQVKISGFGADDPGSLHIWQSTTGSSDINLCLINTLASDLDSGSYTLTMKVKGTFCNTEAFSVYPAFCNDTQIAELNVPKKLQQVTGVAADASGMYVVDEWTELTWTLPAASDGDNGFTYLALMFSKYNNTCEYYIDNIQVLDPDGNDVLGGAGSFMDSGSEYWPIILPAAGGEILNSNTMYYTAKVNGGRVSVSNHVESGVTAGDQNFSVSYNGNTQAASDKNVTVDVESVDGESIVFAITSNKGSIDIPSSTWEAMQRAGEFNIYDVVITDTSCKHTETTTTTVEATCTAAGSVTVTCKACGTVISTTEITAKGHSYGEWEITKNATYTEAGSKKQTCNLCGDVVTEEIPILANPVTSWNITLKDNIGVNFVMALADTDVVTATVNGEAVDCAVTDGKLSVNVAAAQMMDEIAISVNGKPLANTYSVRGYADKILADPAQSACHELVKNMLVYGGAAQTNFSYNSGNLASSGISVDVLAPTGDGEVGVSGGIDGVGFYGATLVHREKIAVRFYFTGSLDGLNVTANGAQAVIGAKNDMTYVEVSGINPQDLGKDVEIVISNGTDSLSVSYSPLDYMVRMYEKGTDATKALVQALYGYYMAAVAYTA